MKQGYQPKKVTQGPHKPPDCGNSVIPAKYYGQQVPKEGIEQKYLFIWARYESGKYPELELLYHIPNGGSRNKLEAARLKEQGVKAGVPDLCLPVARGGYHGLYIELKRLKGGRLSAEQKELIPKLAAQGFCVKECKGWVAASEEIEKYLKLEV
jgi:hypothetical protein